jgi:predicted ABC-type sugar transport system permease subunit
MIEAALILQILFVHWVSDFVLQSHWMATNKSKNIWALSSHVLVYTATFAFIMLMSGILLSTTVWWSSAIMAMLTPVAFAYWIALNGALHFMTDFVTSKITSALWQRADFHNFFVVVGADQLIHYTCLIGTLFLFI